MTTREKRYREYCGTWYKNLPDLDQDELKRTCRYYIFGEEQCPTTDRDHLQWYMYMRNPQTFKAICKLLDGAHVEICKGNAEQNYNYCSKDRKYIEWGIAPHQGFRRDLDDTRKSVANGHFHDVIDHGSWQQIKIAEVWKKYNSPPRDSNIDVNVMWICGEAGIGKSREAERISKRYARSYRKMSGKWWEGYDSEECVIMDDFSIDDYNEKDILKWWDRYPCRVETKGSSIELYATTFIVTSIYTPSQVFGTCKWADQFLRRITSIKYME